MRSAAILFVASIVSVVQPGSAPGDEQSEERKKMAKAFVTQMAAGEFEKAVEPFDETMKRVIPADKLKEVWQGITSQHGSFKQIGDVRTGAVPNYQIVFVTTELERGKVDTKIVFDADHQIAGLFFVPPGKYASPPYVKLMAFDEVEITVGKGLLPLSGTLSLPKGDGRFPAVVLVHGSGPHDRDETIGPNKPFRDLAQGLASLGIAVLRYEKRTKQHPLAMAVFASSITVKQETIDDAAAAVDALASHERINKGQIFVLGHSLGGTLIPRIAKANDKIAGFICLAGSVRPLDVLLIEQTKYILSLDGPMTEEKRKQIEQLEQQIAKIRLPDLSLQTAAKELPLGVPASYWLDLRGYDPAEAAKEIAKPILILQGERDYQVTMEDFGLWKAALGSSLRVRFISYSTLNHLFVEGKGKSSPAEYSAPGNVAEVVVRDIATWINSQSQQ